MLGIPVGAITVYSQKRRWRRSASGGRLLSEDQVHILGPTTECEVSAEWEYGTRIAPRMGEDPLKRLIDLGVGSPKTSDWR